MPVRRFASSTDVTAEGSRRALDKLFDRYGCSNRMVGKQGLLWQIVFETHGRRIRFYLQEGDVHEFIPKTQRRGRKVSPKLWAERETRRRWRLLLLCIQTNLELIENGAPVDAVFTYNILTAGGRTVGELMQDQLDRICDTGRMPSLLAAPGDNSRRDE